MQDGRRVASRLLAPDAKGQPPAKAQAAPVVPLDNLKPGQVSPNVFVVPVACCGKVPGAIQKPIRSQIAKAVPDSVVWLDFADTMKGMYGQTAGEPNLVVFDAAGRMRMKLNGTPDQAAMDKLMKTVQELRYEASEVTLAVPISFGAQHRRSHTSSITFRALPSISPFGTIFSSPVTSVRSPVQWTAVPPPSASANVSASARCCSRRSPWRTP